MVSIAQTARGTQERPLDAPSGQRVSAPEWFASGARRPYDPIGKTML
jgi:hypothetical protein